MKTMEAAGSVTRPQKCACCLKGSAECAKDLRSTLICDAAAMDTPSMTTHGTKSLEGNPLNLPKVLAAAAIGGMLGGGSVALLIFRRKIQSSSHHGYLALV
mmetsp:Transcript_11859/g.22170  ORF Transcript_11859/g.22170 Transcript_11859/m.22170 type:complete len:101 (-) Transcript_11859:100-402(-)